LKVNTSRFGQIEILEEDVLSIPEGLIGFPDLNKFVLLDHDENSPFKWLQCISDPDMAFVVISPLTFKPDYVVEVGEEEIGSLGITKPEEAVISVIVTVPSDPKKMSANLKAPLIFNIQNKIGKQIVLKDLQYNTKHFIIEEMKKNSKNNQIDLSHTLKGQVAEGELVQK
jgi:flagellar assembly factor FliW